MRGSKDGPNPALHLVSAYATTLGVSLGQEGTAGKGNELAAIKALLDTLVLKGSIVTMDALGCQTEVVEKIVTQGGDYVLAVKDNQKNLSRVIVEFFDTAIAFGSRNIALEKCTKAGSKPAVPSLFPTSRGWIRPCVRDGRSSLPHALSAIRKFALSALRADTQHPERSLRRRRKLADWHPEYRSELLGIKRPYVFSSHP